MLKNRSKKNLMIILLVLMIISALGVSTAYYIGDIIGNRNNAINMHTVTYGDLIVSYHNSNGTLDMGTVNLNSATVGTTLSYMLKFQVQNTSTNSDTYSVNWINLNNGFCQYRNSSYVCTNNSIDTYVGDELTYQLFTCTESNYTNATTTNVSTNCTKISPSTDAAVPATGSTARLQEGYSISINGTSTQYYVLVLNLENLTTNQNYQLDATFNGAINVTRDVYVPTLTDKILETYTPISDAIASTYVSAASGIDFNAISSPTNGQGLYTNVKNSQNGTVKYFRGGTYCTYPNFNIEVKEGTYCTAAGGVWSTVNYHCNYNDSQSLCEDAGYTFYELKNNVIFGGYAWKIIRINSDGSIRMIYNGLAPSARGTDAQLTIMPAYNTPTAYDTGTGPGTSSEINLALDYASYDGGNLEAGIHTWYTNLSAVTTYLADSEFCSDITWGRTNATWFFVSFTRIYTDDAATVLSPTPTFSCNSGSVYTVANTKLASPVALITSDEVMYAGAKADTMNFMYYLHSGSIYWTMSPSTWGANNVLAFAVASNGWLTRHSVKREDDGVRPVINLKSDVLVSAGDGSLSNPWVITTN